MRNSELGTKLDKEKAGGQCGLQGLARQKSLHHTGKKLGSGSELCTLSMEKPQAGLYIRGCPVHPSVVG